MTDRQLGSMIWEDEGTGRPVLMIHGLGGSSNSFQTLISALGHCRVLRIDLPGAGRSGWRAGAGGLETLINSVRDCLDASAVASAHVVGHSMGTLIAQHLAASWPERVNSLCLFGAIDEPPFAARQALKARAAQAQSEGMAQIAQSVSTASLSQQGGLSQTFVRESLMRQSPQGYAAHCLALAESERAQHDAIQCPTLIVTGADDSVSPPEMAKGLHANISDSKLQILNSVGHWAMIESPQESRNLLQQHLNDQPDG